MADRPTDLPTFATSANYTTGPDTGSPTKVAYSSGDIVNGHIRGAANPPNPQKFNWWFNLVGRWITWIDEVLARIISGGTETAAVTTGTVNDYSPTNWDTTSVHLITNGSGGTVFTGFAAPAADASPFRWLVNLDADPIFIDSASTASAAANRVLLNQYNNSRIEIRRYEVCFLVYNRATARWHASVSPVRGATSTATITLTGGSTTNNRSFNYDESTATTLSVGSTSGTATISGMNPLVGAIPVAGMKLIELTGNVTFLHESASSTAANRFSVTGGGDWVGASGDRAFLVYAPSPGSQRWIVHPIKPPGAGGGGFTESEAVATVSGTNNDYSPAGWQDATSVILSGAGTVTGFAAPSVGKPKFKRIIVTGENSTILFRHMNTSSSAANRIEFPNPFVDSALSYDTRLVRGCSMWIAYNTSEARWQAVMSAPADSFQAPTMYIGSGGELGMGSARGYDNVVIEGSGPGPYVLNGIIPPSSVASTSPRTSLKLLRFNSAVTVVHNAAAISPTSRIYLTGGTDWSAAVGDFALMSYDAALQRYVIHPCKTAASPAVTTTNVTARTLSSNTVQTWTGSTAPVFTFASGTARSCTEIIQFPASSLVSLTLSTDLDPTGTVAYTFDDSLAAYILVLQYIEAGPCIVATLRKVTDLTP